MNRQEFLKNVTSKIQQKELIEADKLHYKTRERSIEFAKTYFDKYDLAKQRAAYLKNKALENADKLLSTFEFDLNNTHIKVIWTVDADDVIKEMNSISKIHNQLPFLVNQSEITDEIIYTNGRENEIKITEDQSLDFISVSKADFVISDSSSIVNLSDTQTKEISGSVQVFIGGIDSVLQSFQELELFISLYSTNKFGKPLPKHINIYNGNKISDNDSFKNPVYVILVDNGRTLMMTDPDQRALLSCIQCDACINACPVSIYSDKSLVGTIYKGPYGALVSEYLQQNTDFKHLPYASTLCGKCNVVCPMNIDLSGLMIHSRRNAVNSGDVSKSENLIIYIWKNAVLKRSNMDKGGAKIKFFMFKQMMRKQWGNHRDMPVPAAKSFNQLWRERKQL